LADALLQALGRLTTTAITIDQLFFLASASAAAMAFMAVSCPIGAP
jgi:hypothetical protein